MLTRAMSQLWQPSSSPRWQWMCQPSTSRTSSSTWWWRMCQPCWFCCSDGRSVFMPRLVTVSSGDRSTKLISWLVYKVALSMLCHVSHPPAIQLCKCSSPNSLPAMQHGISDKFTAQHLTFNIKSTCPLAANNNADVLLSMFLVTRGLL